MSRRVQIPLSPKLEKALDEWVDASGWSRAATCALFLEECTPTLREMTKAVRAAENAPDDALVGYASFLEKVIAEAKETHGKVKSRKSGR